MIYDNIPTTSKAIAHANSQFDGNTNAYTAKHTTPHNTRIAPKYFKNVFILFLY